MADINFSSADSELIRTIQQAAGVQTIQPQEGQAFSRPLHLAPLPPQAAAIVIASLSGLVEYIKTSQDAHYWAGSAPFVTVESPTQVSVMSSVVKDTDRRFVPITAVHRPIGIGLLINYLETEQAVIELQSCFVKTSERDDLIRKLGSLVKDTSIRLGDDGVTQEVATRRGVKVEEERIVNPVMLQPFRTFPEVTQPECPFVVRIDNDDMTVRLYPADGGKWELDARHAIADYLRAALADTAATVLA